MDVSAEQQTIDRLNEGLRVYRRFGFRLLGIFVLGLAAVIALGYLSTALSPPYGVYIFGEDLSTWGLIVMLLLLITEVTWESRQIRKALNDPQFPPEHYLGITSGLPVIAQRAKDIGMEWSGFFRPLRPSRRK